MAEFREGGRLRFFEEEVWVRKRDGKRDAVAECHSRNPLPPWIFLQAKPPKLISGDFHEGAPAMEVTVKTVSRRWPIRTTHLLKTIDET